MLGHIPSTGQWYVHLSLFIHFISTLHIFKLHQRSAMCQVSQNQWHWHPSLCLGNKLLFKTADIQQASHRWSVKVQAPPLHTWTRKLLGSDHWTHIGRFSDALKRRSSFHSSSSRYGVHLRSDWVLAMFSAGHLLDSLGELPASLTNVPGSVANTLDWAGKVIFLFKDRALPPTLTAVGDATAQRNFSLLQKFLLSHYRPPVWEHTGVWCERCWHRRNRDWAISANDCHPVWLCIPSKKFKKVSICGGQNEAVFSWNSLDESFVFKTDSFIRTLGVGTKIPVTLCLWSPPSV